MIIGVDIDDVLADFIGEFTVLANKHYGVPLKTRPNSWSWDNYGLSKGQIDRLWRDIYGIENFWLKCSQSPGCATLTNEYYSFKDRFYFVTARKETVGRPPDVQTAEWLYGNFGIEYTTVICSANKGPIAAALGFEAFIDDRPKNCEEVLAAVPSCKVYLKKSHHNADYDCPKGIIRVDDFDHFARIKNTDANGVASTPQGTLRHSSGLDDLKESRLRSERGPVQELSPVR